jgi:hypothetical protein
MPKKGDKSSAPGRRQRFTIDQVGEALRLKMGIHSAAADVLGCSPNTVRGYVRRSKKLQKIVDEVHEDLKDVLVSQFWEVVSDPEKGHRAFGPFIIHGLRTFARDRGFGDKLELGTSGNAPLPIAFFLPEEQPDAEAPTRRVKPLAPAPAPADGDDHDHQG